MAQPHQSDERSERLGRLFEQHVDFVWRSVCRLGCPDDQADDAVQEVFLVVLRRLDDLRSDDEARPWLFAICRRVVSGHRRKETRRRAIVADLRIAPEPGDLEAEAERRAAARLVNDFVAELDEARRIPFVLYELEGFTGRQIAETTGWKLNTVFTRIKAARRRLEAFVAKANDR